MKAKWFSTLLIVMMLVVAIVPSAGVAPVAQDDLPGIAAHNDNPSHPLGDEQIELKAKGFEAKVNGKVDGPVAEVARGQFVELAREGKIRFGQFSVNLEHRFIQLLVERQVHYTTKFLNLIVP